MRPEHRETKAKTETRECENKTATETKNYETETSLVNSVAYESKRNRYAFIMDYTLCLKKNIPDVFSYNS